MERSSKSRSENHRTNVVRVLAPLVLGVCGVLALVGASQAVTSLATAATVQAAAAGQTQKKAAGSQAKSAPSKVQEYLDFPVVVQAPLQPIAVRGEDGSWHLVYHLLLTNWSASELSLKRFEALEGRQGATIASYDHQELGDPAKLQAMPPGVQAGTGSDPADARKIGSGRSVALFLSLAFGSSDAVPVSVRHRFVFEPNSQFRLRRDSMADDIGDLQFETINLPVRSERPMVLRPPLRGGPWKVSGGLSAGGLHQALVLRDGRVRVPERFGCEFSLADDKGGLLPEAAPAELTNAMYYGYGAEVLAVAEGVVSSLRDGLADMAPAASAGAKKFSPTRDTIAGNWIGIDLGGSRWAFYTHLQSGSARVKLGDRVRAGQVIALVGNSGDSRAPHLHFHVGDASTPFGCEGLPFVFESFQIVGQAQAHTLELPLGDAVLRFP